MPDHRQHLFLRPKPFTPFQWASMCPEEEYLSRAAVVRDEIKEQLNKKSIRYSWHEADVTILEGVLPGETGKWPTSF